MRFELNIIKLIKPEAKIVLSYVFLIIQGKDNVKDPKLVQWDTTGMN